MQELAVRHNIPQVTRKTSRSILSDWNVTLSQVNNDRALTVKFQEEILARKLEDEKEAVQATGAVITERTFVDLFVYALVALGKDNEYSDWLNEYYNKCMVAQQSYAHVVYLRGGHFRPVHDGVRATNIHYSYMVDSTMLHYTELMSPQWVTIDEPALDLRVRQVMQLIQPTAFER